MTSRFQFTLVVLVLFLSAATLLFGWVYLDNLESKYNSLLYAPQEDIQTIAQLEEKAKMLENKIYELEKKIDEKQNVVIVQESAENDATFSQTDVNSIGETFEIYIDSKCFNSEGVNECAVLSSTKLTESITIQVTPMSEIITDGFNEIKFSFMQAGKEYTHIKTITKQLLDTTKPIATVTFVNKNDLTLDTVHGANQEVKVFTWDGSAWIDYSQYRF